MAAPKLVYKKKELLKMGWATVGGRIEDYAHIYNKKGPKAAYAAIKSHYGEENTDDVYRGMLVYLKGGTDSYYNERTFQSLAEDKIYEAYERSILLVTEANLNNEI
jgi:hypothetical protein